MNFFAFMAAAAAFTSGTAHASEPDLVIYAYDSFAAKGGLGPAIIPLFEKRCSCKVSVLPSGDGAQLLNRLELDAAAKRKSADVVVGLDQSIWERAKPLIEPWGKWVPRGLKEVSSGLQVESGFLPFDYGVFAWIADEQAMAAKKLPEPKRLEDFLLPVYRRSLLFEDPRTSTPGLAFLLFTRQKLGDVKVWDFWRDFRSQWLTLSPGWDQAYGLFLKGEAPLVWSYVTSQAYHVEHGEPSRYKAVLFEEGNPIQIEGAAMVKGARVQFAKQFLEFLLAPEVQEKIPLANWMYPVVAKTKLPPSFASLPQAKAISTGPVSENFSSGTLKSWGRVIQGGKP